MYIRFAQPVFDRELESLYPSASSRKTTLPAVDIVENEGGYELVAELPGVKKDDVKISIEARTLTLSGERKHYGFPEGTTMLHHETQTDPFRRSFELPEEVEASAISAELNNGILRVRLPKVEKAQPLDIKIK